MGNVESDRGFFEMKRLEEITGIQRQRFVEFHENAKRTAADERHILIDRADCRHYINQMGVGSADQRQVDAAFQFFEKDGKLLVEAVFSIIVILSETMNGTERFKYVIDTHNTKGGDNERLTRDYGLKVIQGVIDFFDIKKAPEPEQVWIQLCGGTDKKQVKRDKFVRYLTSTAPFADFLV